MRNLNNTLHYSQYAGELKAQVRLRIEKAKSQGKDLLIVADTSAGKTTLSNDLIADFSKDGQRSALVAPLQSIVNSKKGSHDEIDFGFGNFFIMGNEMTENALFSVYNSIADSHLLKDLEYLFVDETQVIISQANIRGRVNGKLLDSDCTKVFLTGTELMIPQALGCDVLYLDRAEPNTKRRIVKHYEVTGNDLEILDQVEKHDKGHSTKIIRINNKKSIQTFAGILKTHGHTVATYYSFDSEEAYLEENKEYLLFNELEDLRAGIFNNVDFVLCTPSLDSGVDIVCDRTVYLYAIGRQDAERDNVRLMPHPIDVKQFSARNRAQEVINVYVLGRFDGSAEVTYDYYEGKDAMFEYMREHALDTMGYLKLCAEEYSKAEYNDMESYVDLLKYYGLEVINKGSLDTVQGINIRLRSNLTVLRHLYLSQQYDLIQQSETYFIEHNDDSHKVVYDLGIDLEGTMDRDSEMIIRPSDVVQFEEVARYIVDASNYGINLSPFINAREFKLEKLKDIIECVKYLSKDTILGRAIRRAIKEGSISKSDLYMLETSEATITTFLRMYFKVSTQAFSRDEIKNIKIKGIKNTATPPPIPLIKYLAANKPEWSEKLIDKVKYTNEISKLMVMIMA